MAPPSRLHGMDRGERVALLISECQTAIVDPAIAMFRGLADQVTDRGIIARIAALAEICRSSDVPVIHCTVRLLPGARGFTVSSPLHAIMRRNPMLCADRAESAIVPGLAPYPDDVICERHHGITAFHGTDLEALLRGFGVETVILTGVSTNIALPGMAIEAVNRGFSVVIPEDCTAGGSTETHEHAVRHTLPILASITRSDVVAARIEQSA